MASSAKSLPLFFLLILLFSLQTLARDSQFFSKVTREANGNTNPDVTYSNNLQKTQVKVPAKEEDPAFLPQTTQTEYGLYGRETAATTTTIKNSQPQYRPQGEEPMYYNNNYNNMEKFETQEEGTPSTTTTTNEPQFHNYHHQKNYATELQGLGGYTKENGNNYNKYNKNNYYYNGEKQGMSDTRFMENGKYFYDTSSEKGNNIPNYYGHQSPNGRPEFDNNKNSYYHNGEQQGMSDTRFMENGKYFVDVNNEKTSIPNYYGSQSGHGKTEYYNNNGHYSGSTENFNRYYQNNHGMQGDQSLEEEDEFDFDP